MELGSGGSAVPLGMPQHPTGTATLCGRAVAWPPAASACGPCGLQGKGRTGQAETMRTPSWSGTPC
uniref:Alternative protein n=1 Tax=Macrostomum lignano TaxID=282301 RepID=A0A1I8FHK5_9PLAT